MVDQGSRARRGAGIAAIVAALGISTLGLTAPAAMAQPEADPGPEHGEQLDKADQKRLAAAERAGEERVTLLVAAQRGRAAAAVGALRSIGGTVESSNDELDYLKVSVPLSAASEAASLSSVKAVDVDGLIKLDDPSPNGSTDPLPQPAPGPDTPRINPYLPTGDTHAAHFGMAFPFWDGTGATIAVVDTGIDLDHPALQQTSHGQPKVVDWYTANAPGSGDGTWVSMSEETYVGTFSANERDWTAPTEGGPYTFGVFSETAGDLGNEASATGGDINRDGDTTDSWGVLQDTATKEVRVDLNGNGDFTDEQAMIDYKSRQDSGFFGTDDPATEIVERMAFVVQTDHEGLVNIGLASAPHGTHVAGIAAGNDLFGGEMDGAAPGAQLISVKACLSTPACTASGLVDGVVYAAQNGADVVNISIGGLPALNDGNNARAELYNRIIEEFNVQLFISAGNAGAGANSVGDPSVATDAVSVGSYITDDTWLSNYGSESPEAEALHPFSSRGPREDGGFKPNIVAPGAAISSIPRWLPSEPVPGTYELPVGYAMYNGTSMAAPEAAGAAALLVSTYKGIYGQGPDVASLRGAISSTARFVDGIPAYAQGAGLFDVFTAAFTLMLNPRPDQVTTSVPVNTVLDEFLEQPGIGVGIHDREGVTAGETYTRTYTLTRATGAEEPVNYRASWVGNDGTFSSARQVELPLNEPVSFDVQVNPAEPGAHSALLRLDNPRTLGIDVQTMNAVFAAQEFTSERGYQVQASGEVGRNQAKSVFVRVPEEATALKVDMAAGGAPGKGQVRFLRYDPTGVPIDSNSSLNCYNPDSGGGCAGGSPTSRTVTDPMPGVWEISVEARRTSDVPVAPWAITATVLGTSITPNPDEIASATIGEPIDREYTVTNSLAGFTGRLTAGELGSAKISRPTIADGAQQQIPVTVPEGATSLTATIGNPADIGADLDLVILDCTSGTCVQAAQDADGDSEESATVTDPAPGQWAVLVDAYAVPAGSTEFDYLDVYTSPELGTIEVDDADAQRPSGSSWTAPATITAQAQPGEGRVLRGTLAVRTDEDIAVGTGSILIQSVTG